MDADNEVPELIERVASEMGNMAELARRVGVYQGTLSAVVERRKKLGPELAQKLAEHLGVTQTWLMIKAGWITDADDPESLAMQRIRTALRGANADTEEEIAQVAEVIAHRRKKGDSAASTRTRAATRKT